MKYTISEMSELLGVTTHMLRNYEKLGIISPEIDKNNGYRYYTVLDTRRFILSRAFHSAGIPLTICADIMNQDYSLEKVTDVFEKQLEAIEWEQIRLKYVKEYLTYQLELLPVLKDQIDKLVIEHFSEPFWYLSFSTDEIADNSRLKQDEKEKWIKAMPGVKWVSKIPHEELIKYSSGVIHYTYGMLCSQSTARELGLKRTENVHIVPAGDYITTLHTKKERGPFTWEDIQTMTTYLRQRGIQSFGDGFSSIIASYRENGEQVNVHKLFVKIL